MECWDQSLGNTIKNHITTACTRTAIALKLSFSQSFNKGSAVIHFHQGRRSTQALCTLYKNGRYRLENKSNGKSK